MVLFIIISVFVIGAGLAIFFGSTSKKMQDKQWQEELEARERMKQEDLDKQKQWEAEENQKVLVESVKQADQPKQEGQSSLHSLFADAAGKTDNMVVGEVSEEWLKDAKEANLFGLGENNAK